MSLLRRVARPDTEQRATYSLKQLGMLLAPPTGGPRVATVDEALRDAATWACVQAKAKGLAMLPVDEVRYDGKQRIPMPPSRFTRQPGPGVSRRVWLYQAASSMFTDGNVFGLVVDTDSMQRPTSIALLDPSQCRDRKVVDGVKQVTIDSDVHKEFPHGDLWHVAGEMVLGGSPFGLSPVFYGSRATGTSLAAEQFGGQFFTDGAHPTWMLSPESNPGEEGARSLKEKFIAATKGNREPIVLPKSTTATKLSVDPKDSQFLDLMRFEVEQTCRRHGVPPSMVYGAISGQNVTYTSVTQADLHFLKHTLSYPIDLLEDAMSACLSAPRVIKLNRNAILRGDPTQRWAIHDLRLKNRSTSIDEVRAIEDEEPYGGEFAEPGIPGVVPAMSTVAAPGGAADSEEVDV